MRSPEQKKYMREYTRVYRNTPKGYGKHRVSQWKRYGINLTVDQYNQMLIDQKGLCAICGSNRTQRELAVDHDHNTGKIRGLLCGKCNTALGQMDENPDYLCNMIMYLEAFDAANEIEIDKD